MASEEGNGRSGKRKVDCEESVCSNTEFLEITEEELSAVKTLLVDYRQGRIGNRLCGQFHNWEFWEDLCDELRSRGCSMSARKLILTGQELERQYHELQEKAERERKVVEFLESMGDLEAILRHLLNLTSTIPTPMEGQSSRPTDGNPKGGTSSFGEAAGKLPASMMKECKGKDKEGDEAGNSGHGN